MLLMTDEEILKDKPSGVLTSASERGARLAQCTACPEKISVTGFNVCNQCSCILSFKTLFKLSPCPLNKWDIPINELPKEQNV